MFSDTLEHEIQDNFFKTIQHWLLLKIHLFLCECQCYTERNSKRKRKNLPFCYLVVDQMAAIPRKKLEGRSQACHLMSHMGARIQVFWSSSITYPGALVGSWMINAKASELGPKWNYVYSANPSLKKIIIYKTYV